LGEPGVSYLIQDEGRKILFDVGYSDAFIKNAQKMNIHFWDLDYLVLSHGHLDHTWGLTSLIKHYTETSIEKIDYNRLTVVTHPSSFLTKKDKKLKQIGSMISQEELSKHFKMKLSKKPLWLTERLVFLGEIERKNNFEAKKPIGKVVKDDFEEDDYSIDDSALAYRSTKGLVIITGCSHSGICNIVEYAKKICRDDRIIDIVGGFHLLNPEKKQLEGTLRYLEKIKPYEVHACHCTDFKSKIALSQVTNFKEVGVGQTLKYK
jgi:7,8-dihydropterin-6-yl-methyl-4-(beta-D-ribofuranosyl)aminobenzene 5'-phosphate synthase